MGQAVEKSVVEQIGLQPVTAVSLMQSDLRPTGAVYSRLSAHSRWPGQRMPAKED